MVRAANGNRNSNLSNNGAICRGWHQNQLVPGTTTTPDPRDDTVIKCAVKQFAGSSMHFLDSFQVSLIHFCLLNYMKLICAKHLRFMIKLKPINEYVLGYG